MDIYIYIDKLRCSPEHVNLMKSSMESFYSQVLSTWPLSLSNLELLLFLIAKLPSIVNGVASSERGRSVRLPDLNIMDSAGTIWNRIC